MIGNKIDKTVRVMFTPGIVSLPICIPYSPNAGTEIIYSTFASFQLAQFLSVD